MYEFDHKFRVVGSIGDGAFFFPLQQGHGVLVGIVGSALLLHDVTLGRGRILVNHACRLSSHAFEAVKCSRRLVWLRFEDFRFP